MPRMYFTVYVTVRDPSSKHAVRHEFTINARSPAEERISYISDATGAPRDKVREIYHQALQETLAQA